MVDLQKNSLRRDGPYVKKLKEVINEADLHLALGANEIGERRGSGTLYNSIFYFDRTGSLVRVHRKLMPTHEERAIWGRGDPSSLATHDTDIGTIGGLICYENHMTLSKAALTAMGEDIHPAVWPGFWEQNNHPGDKARAKSSDSIETCDIYAAMREYAFETQSFVVSCSAFMQDDAFDDFTDDEIGFNVAAGGSMLINPAGIVKEGPVIGEEALITTVFDRDERRATKAYFDAMGHYSRWDAVSLSINRDSYGPFGNLDTTDPTFGLTDDRINTIAEKHDVSPDAIVEIITDLQEQATSAKSD